MSTLTKEEAEAVIYFAVGVATEGSDAAYRLSFAGNITHDAQGRPHLTPADSLNRGHHFAAGVNRAVAVPPRRCRRVSARLAAHRRGYRRCRGG